jgi:plastocyanin
LLLHIKHVNVNFVYSYLYNDFGNKKQEWKRIEMEKKLDRISIFGKNITPILVTSLIGIGLITILNSDDINIITVSEKNVAHAQLEDSTASQNIVDLKVSERNNNFVWTSVNGQANPTLNLKSGIDYTIQVESMDNNITHQLIIQNESGKQLTKSDEISNGQTDDFTFTFRDIGKYQYHCQYHPETMHGNLVVS